MAQVSYGTITITDTTDVDHIESWYLASEYNTGITINTIGWTNDINNPNAQISASKRYLWTHEKYWGNWNNGVGSNLLQTTSPRVIGTYSENGRGISQVNKYYGIAAASEGITITDEEGNLSGGWQSTPPLMTAQYPYLWYYESIVYVNPATTTTIQPYVIGVLGRDGMNGGEGPQGPQGPQGISGNPGASVTDVIPLYYLKTTDTSVAPTINGSSIIYNEDIIDSWTSVIPTYRLGSVYYTCLKTILDNDTSNPVFSEVIEDVSLTESKVKIDALETKTHKIIANDTGLIVAGGNESTFNGNNVNSYGYNSIAAPGYIALRYNDKKLMQLGASGISIYSLLQTDAQGNIVEGTKALEIDSQGLSIFKVDSTDPAIRLTAQALTFFNPTNTNPGIQVTESALNLYDPSTGRQAAQLTNGVLTFYDTSTAQSKAIASYGSDIDIGDVDGYHVHIGTDDATGEVGFYYGNNKVAYINTEQLYIGRSVVLNEMLVGEKEVDGERIACWAWRYDESDDSIYLKWLGQ